MGSFIANIHVRTEDRPRVERALTGLSEDWDLQGPDNGWLTVTEARASMQDPDWIEKLARELSLATGAPTVAFLVHDSDTLQCWVAELGRIGSHLDTWPGWPDDEPTPSIGSPGALLALAPRLTEPKLRALVSRDVVFADDLLVELADHLGISQARALADHRHLEDAPLDGGELLAGLGARLQQLAGPQAAAADPQGRALVQAADAGDLDTLRRLLSEGADPDALGPWRPSKARSGPAAGVFPEIPVTPLYAAAAEGRVDAIRLLLLKGASPDKPVPQGDIPLCAAAAAGRVHAVQALLDGGADPGATRVDGTTTLQIVTATIGQLDMLRDSLKGLGLPGFDPGAHLPDADDLRRCLALIEAAEDS